MKTYYDAATNSYGLDNPNTKTPIADAIEATESQFDIVQVCDDYRATCRKFETERAALIAALKSIREASKTRDAGEAARQCQMLADATLARVKS
jgi:hypothetical protein